MDLLKTLLFAVPNAQFCLRGETIDGLEWLDTRPLPSMEELQVKWSEYQALVEQGKDPLKPEDWTGLAQDFTGDSIFLEIYQLAKQNPSIAMPFNLLRDVILTTHNSDRLEYFLIDLQSELGEFLTPEKLARVNQILSQNGFKLALEA